MSDNMDLKLDRLLADMAKAPLPPPPDALMTRILADADRLQPPGPVPVQPRSGSLPDRGGISLTAPAGRAGWFGTLVAFVGGRGALAGMMLASVAGLYLGVAQPVTLTGLTSLYSQTPLDSLDLLSGSDSLWTETTK